MRNQKGFMNMDFTAVFIFLGALCVAVGMFLSWFFTVGLDLGKVLYSCPDCLICQHNNS